MRTKLVLLATVAAFTLALVAAPTASARYIKVTAMYSYTGFCRPAPDQLSFKLVFKAKVKRRGVAKPDKVRIGYQVMHADTMSVFKSGVVNLKRSKGYKATSPYVTAPAGTPLLYHFNMKYVSEGRTVKAKLTDTDAVPSVEDMDAAGIPACVPVG